MDAIKTTEDATASRSASLSLQSKKRPKTAEDQEGAAAANATAAAARLAKETGSKACTIHCLETGDKLVGNLAQIIGMSGTIRRMVEDLGVDTAGTAAVEIPIAGVSGDVAKGILQCIEAYYDEPDGKCSQAGCPKNCPTNAKVPGVCIKHGAFGTCTNPLRYCTFFALARGRCIKHLSDKTCTAPACETGDAGTKQKKAATKMPESMMDLYRLGDDASGRKGHEHWSGYGSNYITELVEAVEFLDVPTLMTIILTIVGEEISSLAGRRVQRLSRTTTPGKSCGTLLECTNYLLFLVLSLSCTLFDTSKHTLTHPTRPL